MAMASSGIFLRGGTRGRREKTEAKKGGRARRPGASGSVPAMQPSDKSVHTSVFCLLSSVFFLRVLPNQHKGGPTEGVRVGLAHFQHGPLKRFRLIAMRAESLVEQPHDLRAALI